MGYIDPDDNPKYSGPGTPREILIWQENNYAEIYADSNKHQTVIMASAGCGVREYVNFLAQAFKMYDDIDEVFIQSTYWGRFALAINPDLNEKATFPLDFFLSTDPKTEFVDRYSLGMVQKDKYMMAYTSPKFADYARNKYIMDTSPNKQPSISQSSYMYIKMWHYLQTHLEQQDYFKDIFMCDALCTTNKAKMYLWNFNNRQYIPKETNSFYSKLQSTTIADIDAISYVSKFTKQDLEAEKADSEHYSVYVHNLVATHYIPYLRSLV
jgi:hypothetical protein